MYFVRYQPLKDRLRSRSVSDREALPYLVLMALGISPAFRHFDSSNVWSGVSLLLSTAVAVGGLLHVYRKNGGAAGYDLIQKAVVLGWVLGVRFLIAALPIMILISIVGERAEVISLDYTGPYDVLIIVVLEVVFYQRLGRHIGDTTAATGSTIAANSVGKSSKLGVKKM